MPLPRSRPTDSAEEAPPAAKTAKAVKTTKATKAAKVAKPVDKLAKLGLTRDIDLVLHLPMRYEDETTLTPIGELLPGVTAQTEGVVVDNEIAYRPRRQLVVKLRDAEGAELALRFLNFYGSQVKQ
ncbi:MAG: ATP-dependent DNA helicase RecG, partial [Burkholderiales bacterium]|nr:ATP-dependent DNA helicase RecG [Burkholderiales bacterium]